jgi:threonine dehydratase
LIVMPSDAPEMKIEGTRRAGAEILFYNRRTENREEIGARLAGERGAVLVHPFGDPAVIAGQGTVGLEILDQIMEAGEAPPLRIVVPTGGGGLTSGIAIACAEANIIGVEPEGWDDMRRSLELGEIVPVSPDAPPTLCDALQTPRPAPLTFETLRDRRATIVTVSEAEVEEAVRFAWDRHKLVVEPGGAAALAALLSAKAEPRGTTVVVLSGGNIDPALHARIIANEV